MTCRPIIITGAGRSGTKLVRRILSCSPDTVVFPREINYIWRHGNIDYPTDELTPEHARPEVRRYIRKRFQDLAGKSGGARVVEKTCANSLRLDFVHSILPEAIVVHVIRDGRAVAESAKLRWQAIPNPRYLLEKLRWVPFQDVPYYAVRFLYFQLGRVRSGKRTAPSSWGPRFSGMEKLISELTLLEVCAIQWQACVQAAEASLARFPLNQVITIYYEDLVAQPIAVVERIYERAHLKCTDAVISFAKLHVHRDSVNRWQQSLSGDEIELVQAHVGPVLQRHGYIS